MDVVRVGIGPSNIRTKGPIKVTLDQVIETMRQTRLIVSSKYNATSLGGLAVNVTNSCDPKGQFLAWSTQAF